MSDLAEIEVVVAAKNNRLKTLRLAEALTQKALAQKLRVSYASVNQLENFSGYREGAAEKLAEYFGVDLDWLFPPWCYRSGAAKRLSLVMGAKDFARLQAAEPLTALPTPEDHMIQRDMSDILRSLLEQLKPREAHVLRRSYGIGCPPQTLAEIARGMGRSRGRIQDIRNEGLRNLKQKCRFLGISLQDLLPT